MTSSFCVQAAAVSMFLAVAAGAFGAHGLKEVLSEYAKGVYETAVRYQVYHALGMFIAAWLLDRHGAPQASRAAMLFLCGTVVFSGSLYALSLTGVKAWGAVTPIGGLLFLAGWAFLFLAARR